MKTIHVPICFQGVAEIQVPENLTSAEAEKLAHSLALSGILAIFDNPDAPETEACEELEGTLGKTSEETAELWDASKKIGISGSWNSSPQLPETKEIIKSLLEVEGNVTVHDGILHFEDATHIDMKDSCQELGIPQT